MGVAEGSELWSTAGSHTLDDQSIVQVGAFRNSQPWHLPLLLQLRLRLHRI